MTSNALALAQKVSILTSSSGASTTTYANTTDLPTSGVTTGAMAYVSANNKLYMWNGTAWFNIAIVNQAPTAITGNQATYVLATDGTPTVVTLVSTDPEGLPLTWSSSTSGDTQVGTVTNTDNVFTITPSTNEANIGTLSVTFSVTDGNNTETSVSSFTLEFVSAYWNETVLSIGTSSTNGLANSSFIDRSTNAHTVTPTGTPVQTAFHPYLENWGVKFDGSGDYLSAPATDILDFGTGDFTIELWLYSTNVTNTAILLSNDGPSRNLGNITFFTGVSGGGFGIQRIITTGGEVEQFYYSSPGLILENTWNHFAVTKVGTTIRLFLNGVLVLTETSAYLSWGTEIDPVQIGKRPIVGFERYVTGYISNLRVVKGTALYTTNFTPPTEKLTAVTGTSLLTCQSNRFVDNSSNAHTITPTGNVEISAFNPFGQESEYAVGENKGSGYFDGSGDYLDLPSANEFDFNSGDFTIEAWIYATASLTTNNRGIIDTRPLTGTVSSNYLFFVNTSGKLQFVFADGFDSDPIISTSTLSPNNWIHVAAARSGDTARLFVNGVVEDSFSVLGKSFNSNLFRVGYRSWSESSLTYWVGNISDFRIVKGTALYTANFTPPTAPVGNTNASLYLPMDNAGIFDKTGNNTLTPVGNASTSTTQTKYANTAMYFDGTGDYLIVPANSETDFGSGDFTIEMWANPDDQTNNSPSLIACAQSWSTGAFYITYDNLGNSKFEVFWAPDDPLISANTTSATGIWHHVAVIRDGTSMVLYVNGTNAGSATISSASSLNLGLGDAVWVGNNGSSSCFYKGYIENLQILKGVAKYTANFTVPDRTQGLTYQQT